MKKLLFTILFLFISSLVLGQTPTENYVRTTSYAVRTLDRVTNEETQQPLTDNDKVETITYYDGLGRPKQAIAKHAGGDRENIITPMVYDGFGRQPKDYLPYAYATGSGDALDYIDQQFDVLGSLETYYLNRYPEDQISPSGINAYSEKHFELSPLNRVLEQGAPGSDWMVDMGGDADHTIKFGYGTNAEGEVELFRVIFPTFNTEQPQLYYDGFYAANELYKTVTKDENWQPTQARPKSHTTEEFRDKQGRVVLKRTFSGTVSHSTHYIYDDYGNLTYVLSPKGSDLVLYKNEYADFFDEISYTEFVPVDKYGEPLTGGQGHTKVTMDQDTQKLTVEFHLNFEEPIDLKNGAISQLSSDIPNILIGTITVDGVNYVVSIQDGYLHIAGEGLLTTVNDSYEIDLPDQSVITDVVDDLCYQYRYDRRNRLVEKKVPQKGWEYIVYDRLDRPVLTQDANLRLQGMWLFTKYDAFDRVVYTGRANATSHRPSVQGILDGQSVLNEARQERPILMDGIDVYYTKYAYPTIVNKLYTVSYYDSYTPDVSTLFPDPITVLGQTVTQDTKSLPTAGKLRILDTDHWITSALYYDEKGRPIYSASENEYLNTTDIASTKLDFVGRAIQTVSSHDKDSNSAIVVTDDYAYDHAGRLLTQKQRIGDAPQELIAKNTYDELGQLVAKDVGNTETSPLQGVNYAYNIRGWLNRINDPGALGNDLFAFAINYNGTELGQGNSALYNGNISETLWRTANDDATSTTRGYAYSYDALNRLSTANLSIDTGSGFALAAGYHENGLQYDRNGNIMSLQRTGATAVFDQLTYAYNGNQLSRVTDAVTGQQDEGFIDGNLEGEDYAYDANGNMVKDLNNGIIGAMGANGIVYNHLNLPEEISFGGINNIRYIYDATGVKLSKQVIKIGVPDKYTYYAGNYIYEDSSLKFFSHPEGYVEPDGSNFDYVYQYKDHLGNIRLSYTEDMANTISIEEDFSSSTYDWYSPGNGGSIDSNNQELNINLLGKWTSTGKFLDLSPNGKVHISFDFDKGTMFGTYFFVRERINGVWEPGANRDAYLLQDGHFSVDLELTGDHVQIYFEKAAGADDGILTTSHVDNFSLKQVALEMVEENNYYPFGLKHKGYNNTPLTNHPYKYNGKELNEELGLDWYDFGARNYDASLGKWMNLDPLAEKMRRHSPYNYAFNNPIYYIDPDGMFPISAQTVSWIYEAAESASRFLREFESNEQLNEVTITADLSNIRDAQMARNAAARETLKLEMQHQDWMFQYGRSPYVDINSPMEAIGNMAEISLIVTAPVLGGTSKAATATEEVSENVTVYLSKTVDDVVQYVGITNNVAIRQAQHLRSKGINIEPLLQVSNRADAKAVEQVLIEMHGLMKNGGSLLNKINSISASNPVYGASLKRGMELLRKVGYK